MNWKPEKDEKPLTVQEFLAIAEKKYPGISRSPYLRQALNAPGASIEDALASLNPVRARSNARLKGYARPLTDKQHIAAFKSHTGVRTYKKRKNPTRRRKSRRNYGPGKSKADLDALFQFFATVYISNDKPVLAVREMIQNSADAINDPKTGSKALGEIGPNDGRIDITFDRNARTLTVEDNGAGMSPEIICKFTTLAGTTKGKPVSRMSKEEVKKNYPPFDIRIRAFAREQSDRLDLGPPDGGQYWVRINGIFQFAEPKRNYDRVLPADYVLDYKSPRTAGGFGAAKAVIFFASTATPPKWDLYTRDNYYTGKMADDDTENQVCADTGRAPVEKVPYRQGTKITIYDLDPALFDGVSASSGQGGRVRGTSEPIESRIKKVIAANNLKGITITFNGEAISSMFPAQGGSVVRFGNEAGSWFDGVFRRPKQRPNPERWVAKDLKGKSSNPQGEYPFSKGRDAFLGDTRDAFYQFQSSVELSMDDLKKEQEDTEPIIFDPADKTKSAENKAVDEALEAGFDTEDMDQFLREAAKAAADYDRAGDAARARKAQADQARRDRQQKEKKARERAGGYSSVDEAQRVIKEGAVNVAEEAEVIASAAEDLEELKRRERQITAQNKREAFRTILRNVHDGIEALNNARIDQNLPSLSSIAYEMNRSYDLYAFIRVFEKIVDFPAIVSARDLTDVFIMQELINKAALDGGNGLIDVASFNNFLKNAFSLYPVDKQKIKEAKTQVGVTNPFGNSTALFVSTTNFTKNKKAKLRDWQGKLVRDEDGKTIDTIMPVFDQARYNRFKKNAGKYVSMLVMWDQVVRSIINAANVRPARGGPIYTGFALDDGVLALFLSPAGSTSNMILINPLSLNALKKTYKNAAELASFVHGSACHEIAHMADGSIHLEGHGDKFAVLRENIGFKTVSLLPLITDLVADWSGLKNPYVRESVAKQKARYRKIAEDVTCPKCLKQAVVSLEDTGRLDTVRWVRERLGWEDADLSSDSDEVV